MWGAKETQSDGAEVKIELFERVFAERESEQPRSVRGEVVAAAVQNAK